MSAWRHVLGFAGLGLLLAGQPGRADVVGEARAMIEGHRLPEAREPLEKLLAREPDNLEARLLLARVYNGVGRRDEGIELLEPAVAAHPDDARVLGLYGGQCLLRAGELGLGLRALRLARRGRDLMERAVLLAPNDISYREGLVDFYRQAPMVAGGSLEKARGHAQAITRLDPVRGGAWEAAILVQEKRFPEAMAACDQALAARPDDYAALFSLGRTVSESGLRLDDGERSLRRCLEMVPAPSEPSHAGVYYRLGLIAELRDDKIAARELYRSSLKLEPTFNRPAEALKRMDQP
jgi:tetratricopeptide (TPR) repeat protein